MKAITLWSPTVRLLTPYHDHPVKTLAITLVALPMAIALSVFAAPEALSEPPRPPASVPAVQESKPAADTRSEEFKKCITNVTLVGNFTMDGAEEANLQREEYVISGAVKLGNGDLWALTSRIRYGTVDITLPVPVHVKWAGDTPVITVDSVAIPGLGTFSARVLLDKSRYAGTWSHDEKGGHMFGVIERNTTEEE